MVSATENETLCRVGAGTPVGNWMRTFWVPGLTSEMLPHPDCDPVRVRLLGQDLVAFRDSEGRVGVLEEACCHRGTSLALGRVERGGIRCIFHGWKYAVDGTLLDAPNVGSELFRGRIKAPAFPAREAGGLIWVYLGAPENAPPLPHFRFMDQEANAIETERVVLDCNYLQVLEGSLDSSHLGILHADLNFFQQGSETVDEFFHEQGDGGRRDTEDNAPELELEPTPFGFYYAATRRPADDEANDYVRITPFIQPFGVMIPPGYNIFDVPIDDQTTALTTVWENPDGRIPREMLREATGLNAPNVWVDGKLQSFAANRFLQDRASMAESFSGIKGLFLEDAAVCLSMGPIVDRAKEHLVPADLAIIKARRCILDGAKRLAEHGREPPVPADTYTSIRAFEDVRPKGLDWRTMIPGARRDLVTETSGSGQA